MSWGTLFVDHPLKTKEAEQRSRLELIDPSSVTGRPAVARADPNGRSGQKTVTGSVEAAASPFTAPKN